MSDDKRKPGRQDRDRINVNEDYELKYWTEQFRVSKEDLAAAVKKVGPMVKDVESELKRGSQA